MLKVYNFIFQELRVQSSRSWIFKYLVFIATLNFWRKRKTCSALNYSIMIIDFMKNNQSLFPVSQINNTTRCDFSPGTHIMNTSWPNSLVTSDTINFITMYDNTWNPSTTFEFTPWVFIRHSPPDSMVCPNTIQIDYIIRV